MDIVWSHSLGAFGLRPLALYLAGAELILRHLVYSRHSQDSRVSSYDLAHPRPAPIPHLPIADTRGRVRTFSQRFLRCTECPFEDPSAVEIPQTRGEGWTMPPSSSCLGDPCSTPTRRPTPIAPPRHPGRTRFYLANATFVGCLSLIIQASLCTLLQVGEEARVCRDRSLA